MVLHGWVILLTFALSNRSYMEDRYIIYLHVNKINNKVYVGITKHSNPKLRWRCGYKNNPYFNYSIKKYGWDGFDHIVLFRNLPKEIAYKLEVKLISRYRKKGICYNISDGGETTSQTISIRKKISKALKGKPKSEEHKRNCSIAILGKHWNKNKDSVIQSVITRKANTGYKRPVWLWNRDVSGANNPMYGKHHTDDTLAKKYKAVIQLDKNNNFIKEYKSIKEAASNINISQTHLVSALKGRSKSAGGFIWKYKEDYI